MSDGSLHPVGAQPAPRPPVVDLGEEPPTTPRPPDTGLARASTGADAVDRVTRGDLRVAAPARPLPTSDEVAETLVRAEDWGADGVAIYLHHHPDARARLARMSHPQLLRELDAAGERLGIRVSSRAVAGEVIAYLGHELRGEVNAVARRRLGRVLRGLDRIAEDPAASRALIELAPRGSHLERIAREHGVIHHDGTDAEAQTAVRAYRAKLSTLRGVLAARRTTAEDLPASTLAVHRERGGIPRDNELAAIVLTPPTDRARRAVEDVASRVPEALLPAPLRIYRNVVVHIVDPLVAQARGDEQRLLREAGL